MANPAWWSPIIAAAIYHRISGTFPHSSSAARALTHPRRCESRKDSQSNGRETVSTNDRRNLHTYIYYARRQRTRGMGNGRNLQLLSNGPDNFYFFPPRSEEELASSLHSSRIREYLHLHLTAPERFHRKYIPIVSSSRRLEFPAFLRLSLQSNNDDNCSEIRMPNNDLT